MKDIVLSILRLVVQWSTILLSVVFRDSFSGGGILRSMGGLVVVLGLTLWLLSRVALGQAFTPSLAPEGFVTKGVFSKLMHPMYTGGFLLFLGIGFSFQSVVGLVLAGLLVHPLLVWSSLKEERQILKKFGEEYLDYKKNTAF